jgi:hypothetical protein
VRGQHFQAPEAGGTGLRGLRVPGEAGELRGGRDPARGSLQALQEGRGAAGPAAGPAPGSALRPAVQCCPHQAIGGTTSRPTSTASTGSSAISPGRPSCRPSRARLAPSGSGTFRRCLPLLKGAPSGCPSLIRNYPRGISPTNSRTIASTSIPETCSPESRN